MEDTFKPSLLHHLVKPRPPRFISYPDYINPCGQSRDSKARKSAESDYFNRSVHFLKIRLLVLMKEFRQAEELLNTRSKKATAPEQLYLQAFKELITICSNPSREEAAPKAKQLSDKYRKKKTCSVAVNDYLFWRWLERVAGLPN